MTLDVLLVGGLLIGPSYVFLYIFGGALRPDYSHISNSVSELLSLRSPNRKTLVGIQVTYALLHILFGVGVLDVAFRVSDSRLFGCIGAWTIVALGAATIGTAIFPQDAEGAPPTAAGRIHKTLVLGVLVPASIASTLLIGLWSKTTGLPGWFTMYSVATAGAIVVMGGAGGAAAKTRFAGLIERIAALVSHQWLFVLALGLLLC